MVLVRLHYHRRAHASVGQWTSTTWLVLSGAEYLGDCPSTASWDVPIARVDHGAAALQRCRRLFHVKGNINMGKRSNLCAYDCRRCRCGPSEFRRTLNREVPIIVPTPNPITCLFVAVENTHNNIINVTTTFRRRAFPTVLWHLRLAVWRLLCRLSQNLHSNKMYLQSPAVTNPLARLNYATRRRVQLGNTPPTSH